MVADARCARASESILFGSSPFSTAARKHDANAGSNSRKPSITMLRMSGSAIASDAAVGAVFTENARPRAAVATSLISVRTILSGSSGASEHRGSCHLSCQCIQRAYACPLGFSFRILLCHGPIAPNYLRTAPTVRQQLRHNRVTHGKVCVLIMAIEANCL